MTPITGECPADTGSRKVPLLVARQEDREAEFFTVLYPYDGKPDLAVTRDGNKLTIRHGRACDVLTLPPDGTRPSVVQGR